MAACLGFDLGPADRFVAMLADGGIAVARGDPAGADATFAGTPEAIAAIVHGGAPLATVTVTGAAAPAARFADLFVLPSKASIAIADARP